MDKVRRQSPALQVVPSASNNPSKPKLYSAIWLAAVAVLYALFAGLHTVSDPDLEWQLALGRWIVQHHHVLSREVFSYTANGREWLYPQLSGLFFYCIYALGGYSLLSFVGAAACVGTIIVLLRTSCMFTNMLAVIAVPLVAYRTAPRADMFTTVLFAIYSRIMWDHYRTGSARLWVLPPLMAIWVNLHLGFTAGVGLLCTYALILLLEVSYKASRKEAIERMCQAFPWVAATLAMTLVNPWGIGIYRALLKQEQVMHVHSSWILEWMFVPLPWANWRLSWRDPQSSFWWLLVIAILAVCITGWRQRFGSALVLSVSLWLAIEHIRFQGLFATVVVVIGGYTLNEEWRRVDLQQWQRLAVNIGAKRLLSNAVAVLACIMCCLIGAYRSWDLVSDHYYLRSNQASSFGYGVSWQYPERAAQFIERNNIPANIFTPYNIGGYFLWRLGYKYADYIDGRAVPFGNDLFFRAYQLEEAAPNSQEWEQESQLRGIKALLLPLDRFQAVSLASQLYAFCNSNDWHPVYIDEVSAVIVRRSPETVGLIDKSAIDCAGLQFPLPPEIATRSTSLSANVQHFNYLANIGGVLYLLHRYVESLEYLDRADSLFADSANLHYLRALVLRDTGHWQDAERELRLCLRLQPSDQIWFSLAQLYSTERNYPSAIDGFKHALDFTSHAYEVWMALGSTYLKLSEPTNALAAFERAEKFNPFKDNSTAIADVFDQRLATGRARAYWLLGQSDRAVAYQKDALRLSGHD